MFGKRRVRPASGRTVRSRYVGRVRALFEPSPRWPAVERQLLALTEVLCGDLHGCPTTAELVDQTEVAVLRAGMDREDRGGRVEADGVELSQD